MTTMTDSLQTVVATAIRNELPASLGPYAGWTYDDISNASADVALTAALSWLAAEADALDLSLVRRIPIPGTYLVEEGEDVAGWIRSHIPSGQEGNE